jgi:hypothetical protein
VPLPSPPSAFPDLKVPEAPKDADRKQREELFIKTCPRMFGRTAITIDPTDDTLRKLLKSRLHFGVGEITQMWERVNVGTWTPDLLDQTIDCLNDMRAVVIELWGGQSKELVPWLEEMVVMTKHFERLIRIRVEVGSDHRVKYNPVIRLRLATEAALWKAKKAG